MEKEILEMFYQTCRIPVCFHFEEEAYSFPQEDYVPLLFAAVYERLTDSPYPICMCTDVNGYYFGCIHLKEGGTLVLGPTFDIPADDNQIHSLMKDAFLSSEYTEAVREWFQAIPCESAHRLLQQLIALNYFLHHIILSVYEIPSIDELGNMTAEAVQSDMVDVTVESLDDVTREYFRSYRTEQQFLSLLENGDTESIKKLFAVNGGDVAGSLGSDNLRHNKNASIIVISLCARKAIECGVSVDTSLSLSNIAIQQIDSAENYAMIMNITYQYVLSYARRIHDVKIPEGLSSDIYTVIEYIQSHINEPLSVTQLTDLTGKSRSYLSVLFKKEMKMGISEYITKAKIDEAKRQLAYSDYPISEIAVYLAFSSQSYFQNTFKKITGMTPLQFRRQFQRIIE